MNAQTILKGPAAITYQGATFCSFSDVQITERVATQSWATDVDGVCDAFPNHVIQEITFTPSTGWQYLNLLLPYASTPLGSSLLNGVDRPLAVHTASGQELTWASAAVLRMPAIELSPRRPILGPVTFVCMKAKDALWSDAASRISIQSAPPGPFGSFPSPRQQAFKADWGSQSPWTQFGSSSGFRIEFDLQARAEETDDQGVVDFTLEGLSARVLCSPIGVSESELIDALQIQGALSEPGQPVSTHARSFQIQGDSFSFHLPSAWMESAELAFSTQTQRFHALAFSALRDPLDQEIQQPLFEVGS